MMKKIDYCPFCGNKAYYHQIKPMKLRYKSHSTVIKQPGFWCDECKEGVIGGEDRIATQNVLQAFRAKVDGLLPPDEIKNIREKLKLTQQNAAEIFGGGVNAFSRYERGETPIPRALSQLLLLLDKHPNLLIELNLLSGARHKGKRSAA